MTQKLGLGAIVRANFEGDEEGYERRLWVQTFDGCWWDEYSTSVDFDELSDVKVVSTGYFPPVEEPTKPLAVIQEAHGFKFVALHSECGQVFWTYDDGSGSKAWSDMEQPVTVLFEGVE